MVYWLDRIGSGVFVALSFLLFSFSVFAEANDAAYINFLAGKASVKSTTDSKDLWRALKVNDKINPGDSVKTGSGSKATILYKGSEFRLSPNATVTIKSLHSKDSDGRVEVSSGLAWFKIVNLGGKKFEASTPISVAGVRGTQFATLYDEATKNAMNCICEGKVEVKSGEKSKPEILSQGTGGWTRPGMDELTKISYKGEIEKDPANPSAVPVALPTFEPKIKKFPILKNCLACHSPKGWSVPDLIKDESYGK